MPPMKRKIPLRLKTNHVQAAMMLLGRIEDGRRPITMAEMASEDERKNLRFLWDRSLVEVVSTNPMTYAITALGSDTRARADTEIARLKEESEAA